MWYSHTDIFQRLEAYNGKELTFGLQALNTFLALGFSILTAICIRKVEEYKYAALFGLFDGFAIFLHFQSNIDPHTFNWIGSIFLGSLMFFIISMIWKMAQTERNEQNERNKTNGTKQTETETKTETRNGNEPNETAPSRIPIQETNEVVLQTALPLETSPNENCITVTKTETKIEFPKSVNPYSWNKMKRESQLRYLDTIEDSETKEILEHNFLKAE